MAADSLLTGEKQAREGKRGTDRERERGGGAVLALSACGRSILPNKDREKKGLLIGHPVGYPNAYRGRELSKQDGKKFAKLQGEGHKFQTFCGRHSFSITLKPNLPRS